MTILIYLHGATYNNHSLTRGQKDKEMTVKLIKERFEIEEKNIRQRIKGRNYEKNNKRIPL
jgi:hypothetical protein